MKKEPRREVVVAVLRKDKYPYPWTVPRSESKSPEQEGAPSKTRDVVRID